MEGQFKLMVMALTGLSVESVGLLEYKMAKSVVNRRVYLEKV